MSQTSVACGLVVILFLLSCVTLTRTLIAVRNLRLEYMTLSDNVKNLSNELDSLKHTVAAINDQSIR